MSGFTRNHYVPEWFQYRFIPPACKEKKFYYLDLKPETRVSKGHRYSRSAMLRWGPPRCFCRDDLYTTVLGEWKSTKIEENFFGPVDDKGKHAVEYLANFEHPSADRDMFRAILRYMSIQKLRTPKGLASLAGITDTSGKNDLLIRMQELQQLFCAIWAECIWSIADASNSATKFILSDHPITVYNEGCFPASKFCRAHSDPEIWLSGTHTIFPLSSDKILILTNLSWVQDRYGNPLKERPNPNPFRRAMFNVMKIQTGRMLSDEEVNEINFIIKRRAYRYIAAAERDWLYPEKQIPTNRWDRLGGGYLLMPDPRDVSFGDELIIGYRSGGSVMFDEYGRQPGQPRYNDKERRKYEHDTHLAFQGEFARVFGPQRRGTSYQFGRKHENIDTPDFHKYHLSLEQKYKPKNSRRRNRRK